MKIQPKVKSWQSYQRWLDTLITYNINTLCLSIQKLNRMLFNELDKHKRQNA